MVQIIIIMENPYVLRVTNKILFFLTYYTIQLWYHLNEWGKKRKNTPQFCNNQEFSFLLLQYHPHPVRSGLNTSIGISAVCVCVLYYK